MHNDSLLPFQRLDVYVAAKELVRRVHAAKIRDKELREQATRAAKGMFLQLSEGLPQDGTAMRNKFFAIAAGSLCEAVAGVDMAATLGAMRADDAAAIQALAVRLKRMLRALLHSR
jgi:four helix bundle protein